VVALGVCNDQHIDTLLDAVASRSPVAIATSIPSPWMRSKTLAASTLGHQGSRNLPWSTPISGYREVDGIRISTLGDANWVETSGEWT
jgi:hypothetical protein